MKKRLTALVLAALVLAALPQTAHAATITASADPAMMPSEGAATLSVTVTNDGTAAMESIYISNPYQLAFETAGVVLNPGESKKFSVTASIPDALLGVPLSFDVSWTENGEIKTGSAAVTVLRGNASGVTLTRSISSTQASPGETVTLTYKVVNSGIVVLTKISLSDSEIAGKTPIFKDITLNPGELYEFTYSYKMGYETVTSAPVVTYTPQGEKNPLTYNNITSQQLGLLNAKLSIEVEQGQPTAEGVTFSILLTNTGNQKLKRITVKDELDNSVTENQSLSLAVGEGKKITYTVRTDTERYVSFKVSASMDSGQTYEDQTKSFVVRKYIDPSLLGVDFKAEVLETLNATGSIKVKFTFVNTGEMQMNDLVLSEQTANELYRQDVFPQGELATEQTIYVGEPRDLVFTLSLTDPAGNPYTYTANIAASYLGDGFLATAATPETVLDSPEVLGESIGGSISTALRTALIVLGVLTFAALIALIVLSVLERKERERIARAKRRREKLLREQQAGAGFTPQAELTDTRVNKRPPTDRS